MSSVCVTQLNFDVFDINPFVDISALFKWRSVFL